MNDSDRWPHRSMTIQERMDRLNELEERMPKVKRGHGIYYRDRVIHISEAQTDVVKADVIEHHRILSSLRFEYFKDVGLLLAVRWARKVFQSHGYPSRCFVFVTHKPGGLRIVDGQRQRRIEKRLVSNWNRNSAPLSKIQCLRPTIYAIYLAVDLEVLPETEPGSELQSAAFILRRFQRVMETRRTRYQENLEDLEDLERLIMFSKRDPRHDNYPPYEIERTRRDAFAMGYEWGREATRVEMEGDALAKRNEREVNQANGRKAGAANRKIASLRQALWFEHLDDQAKRRLWALQSDALQLSSAMKSFKKTLNGGHEHGALFDHVKKPWYEDKLKAWRNQRIAAEVKNEK